MAEWTDEFLEAMRVVGDPVADDVVTMLFKQGQVSAVNTLMRTLTVNEYPAPEDLPPSVRDYLSTTSQLPPWANMDKIHAGERVFWRYGPRLVVVLHCYSLPFCYVARRGVQVLALTGRLTGNPARRVVETAQLLMDTMQPGGLTDATARGRRTIQKVRLMHAAVRRMAQMAPEWKSEFGLPINQEDLAGTLMSFSWVALDGLRKTNINISADDEEAYLHAWRVVGSLLGIREDMNPTTMASAGALTQAVQRRQFAACDEGKMMADALVKMMSYILPGDVLDGIPPLLINYLLGDEHSAMIGIQPSHLARAAALPLNVGGDLLNDAFHGSARITHAAELLDRALLNAIVLVGRGGNRPSFSIPAELRQQWGINWFS